MEFIKNAQVLIPALSGLAVTVWNGDDQVLQQFERNNCFSSQFQPLYTVEGLLRFFKKKDDSGIYDVSDALDTHVVFIKIKEQWIILGPYVLSAWDDRTANILLATIGAQEEMCLPYKNYRCKLPYTEKLVAINIAVILLMNTVGNTPPREIEEIAMSSNMQEKALTEISQLFEEYSIVNKRYELEEQLLDAVANGAATEAITRLRELNTLLPGLRVWSDELKSRIEGASIVRTLLRRAAIQGGLTPIAVDSISQDYAQQLHAISDISKIQGLLEHQIVDFCQAIRANNKNSYSIYVKRAVQYIELHMSQPITAEELSSLSNISKAHFSEVFRKETGYTVKEYIMINRCKRAAELLENGQLQIQEISRYVGYEDNNYFVKKFKKVMGMTPREYRRIKTFY